MIRYWFVSSKYRQSSKLVLFTILLAFVVILLGAYTRLTDAGLSCPDWPHCYGLLTAPHTPEQILDATQKYPATPVVPKKAWTEMVHRYFAGTLGLLVVVLAGSILFSRKATGIKPILIALALLTLIVVQIMLGALTVTAKLKPIIVSSHLAAGLSLLGILWWAYLDLHLQDDFFIRKTRTRMNRFLWPAFALLSLQIILGGWVSSHYAGLACIDLPYCNGRLLPSMNFGAFNTDLITIHMVHRIGALITAAYLGLLALFLLNKPSFRAIGCIMLLLITLQFTLGILNVIWLRPIGIALLHHAIAAILLLTLITALVKSYFMTDNRYGSLFA